MPSLSARTDVEDDASLGEQVKRFGLLRRQLGTSVTRLLPAQTTQSARDALQRSEGVGVRHLGE